MHIKIIAGQFKGRKLVAPKGQETRPTLSRLRENLFNRLSHGYVEDFSHVRVLDLFAGSGALGFEALSRGAAFCLFVDQAIEARSAIRENIQSLGLAGKTKLFRRDATCLGKCAPMQPFDLVFMDPPYGQGLAARALDSASQGGWVHQKSLIVIEEDKKFEIKELDGITLA